jgi:hypothetical protein
VKIALLVRNVPGARRRVEVGNAVIGRPAVVRMVIVPAVIEEVIEVRVVTVPVAAGHSRWLRKLNSKN